ncbi:hypothetical protein KAR91_65020, partial [Candidatus Pacearchaeota archaeon]|nr:hypothetical protein [Candidatus Pacearchaeota archaeon]
MVKKLNLREAAVVDFETLDIMPRPLYPPEPVGVAIDIPGSKPEYLAWGHPTGDNNCSWEDARNKLGTLYDSERPILFHHGKFDIDVGEEHLGLPRMPWEQVHDTLPMLFLQDPRAENFQLKPSAERLLGETPDERDVVNDWLIEKQPIPGKTLGRSKGDNYAGAFVAFAPVKIAGKYAIGDVRRTKKIAAKVYRELDHRGMLEAYDRERRLLYPIMDMEKQGVRVNTEALVHDIEMYQALLTKIEIFLAKKFKVNIDNFNFNSSVQVANALIAAGLADPTLLGTTPTGQLRTSKDALRDGITDLQILNIMQYRAQLKTCLNTFMRPWYETAEQSGGFIYTTWHSTRTERGGAGVGARTGRFSSTPNFQNIPTKFQQLFKSLENKKLPKAPFKLPPLPQVRSYVLPYNDGDILIDRDYCFSKDTEVLTNQGWKLFKDLSREPTEFLAQYKNGEITYEKPIEYQRTKFQGNMVRIHGKRSMDLLVTPNHQCLVQRDWKNEPEFYRADEYPTNHTEQFLAGEWFGGVEESKSLLQLVCAIQADAKVELRSNGSWVAIFSLKKKRKIERLKSLLSALKKSPGMGGSAPTYIETHYPSKPKFSNIRFTIPSLISSYLELTTKTFTREFFKLNLEARKIFLQELQHWDGTTKGDNNWNYGSTNLHNVDVVQELCAITGYRSLIVEYPKLPGKKPFRLIHIRTKDRTWAKAYEKSLVAYNDYVYCVTMPQSTVIVRRNGKVCVTGQSQQELRILGHFEDDVLKEQYIADPWMDVHTFVQNLINSSTGSNYSRKRIKGLSFGILYGMGLGTLAEKLDCSVGMAKKLKAAYLDSIPGIKDMYREMRQRAKANEPIRTWGGREYYCEAPKLIKGKLRTFDYKLFNLLIQASAGDITKEAIIRYVETKPKNHRLLLSVHDELLASIPKRELHRGMKIMKDAMAYR